MAIKIIQPSDSDPTSSGPAGWGPVPTVGGNVSTSIPDPITGQSTTSTQQTTTATTQAIAQAVFLPPAPTWSPLLDSAGGMTSPWITWFQTLTRKLGGYTNTPYDDAQILSDDGQTADLMARAALSDLQSDPMQALAQARMDDQSAYFLVDPAPTGNHLTTWNDWNLSISAAKQPAVNSPTWATLVGNLNAFQFAVNDYLYLESQELLHDWKEGTDLSLHVHWATGGLNDATVRGVKWEIEYTLCNPVEGAFGVTAYTTSTTVSAEFSIPAAQPDRTHRVSHVATISGANIRIGAQLIMRIRRIASVTNPDPDANPFAISFGVHYEADTAGSRSIMTK